ncbi:MAG: M48 family metalloprotease [Pseudomonadales bacterium]|nr:M48 family metalloprotease [Pseudomonadales bacterium]
MRLGLSCWALILTVSAQAFDFGSLISNVQSSDIHNVLDMGKNMVKANENIDQTQEIKIGNGIAASILAQAPVVPNAALQNYVNRVGLWIALQSERPDLPWHFAVIADDDVNAFTTPGGNVLITRGLWRAMHNEAELAGVLGHEITHVVLKHHLKAIQNSMGRAWKEDLASMVADHQGANNTQSQALLKAYKAGTAVYARGLDKDDEYMADRQGMVLAARAGYDPYGLVAVLQTLESMGTSDSHMALILKTHPSPASRIERLKSSIGESLDAYTGGIDNTHEFTQLHQL